MNKKAINVFKEYPLDVGIDEYTVGKGSPRGVCEAIKYHEPLDEGDQHYCDVRFDTGKTLRIFRPDTIEFEEVENG